MKKIFSSLLITAVACQYGMAQVKMNPAAVKYANTITVQDLSKHLHIIASDSLEGRETGERGQKMAADYIASSFAKSKLLRPAKVGDNTSYFQKFELEKRTWGEVYIKVNGKKKIFMQDFYTIGNFNIPKEVNADVAFAGFGIDEEKYSDYNTVNPTNRFVVIFGGEPIDADSNSLITGTQTPSAWASGWRKKAQTAREHGAKACFFVMNETDEEFYKNLNSYKDHISKPSLGFKKEEEDKFGVFFIPISMAADMLNAKEADLLKIKDPIVKQNPNKPRKKVKGIAVSSAEVSLKAEKTSKPVGTENVVGLLEGTDKKDEILVITAHYDHVGIIDSLIYNGADDDGSGTVAVMELAQAFSKAKEEGHGPRRSILFMTVTGEEKGLLGSEYYTENPLFPLSNTVANLNIDMIGRVDKKHEDNADFIYVIGSNMLSSELHKISEEANATYSKLELDYTYNDPKDPNRYYYRSDHYNFAKNNIPVAFYFNGVHEDYHKHTDEVDKINFEKMEKISRLVFYTAWELANRDERIKVDVVKQ
jgi:hypothetical protein